MSLHVRIHEDKSEARLVIVRVIVINNVSFAFMRVRMYKFRRRTGTNESNRLEGIGLVGGRRRRGGVRCQAHLLHLPFLPGIRRCPLEALILALRLNFNRAALNELLCGFLGLFGISYGIFRMTR